MYLPAGRQAMYIHLYETTQALLGDVADRNFGDTIHLGLPKD